LHEEDFIEEVKAVEPKISKPVEQIVQPVSQAVRPEEVKPIEPAQEEVNDMPVRFEHVQATEVEQDFEITNITPKEELSAEMSEEDKKNQFSFTFDLPIQNVQKEEVQEVKLAEHFNINDIEIVGLEEIKPEPKVEVPLSEDKIRHTLEDEFSAEITALKGTTKEDTVEEEEMHFELKVTKEDVTGNDVADEIEDKDVSPMNMTIAELRNRAEIRRKKMKDFNYKFINKLNHHIDDIESEPAYKRMGVDLDEVPSSSESDKNKSRMTLGMDDNDEIQLRSNNSFLHDNVD
jgi:cell division protein FtsZ